LIAGGAQAHRPPHRRSDHDWRHDGNRHSGGCGARLPKHPRPNRFQNRADLRSLSIRADPRGEVGP
jgi:hypothetical protein